jgi:hypothetical protein
MAVSRDNPLAGYFANKEAVELVQEVNNRELSQWNMLNGRGLPNLWRLAYAQAFGMDPNNGRNATQRLEFCGPNQNFVRFRINLTRSLIKQRNTLAAGQRVAFQCLAMNDDARSLAQVPICGKVIDYVFREAEGERICYEALEADGYFGEGFIWSRWNVDGGDMVPVEKPVQATDQFTGQPLFEPAGIGGSETTPIMTTETVQEKSGAPTLHSLYPWNVVREPFSRKSPWICIKEKCSKYELMALYPEKADALKGATVNLNTEPGSFALFNWDLSSVTDDMVIVKHFYHENCKAVPGGRYVGYVGDIVLWDLPCPVSSGLPVVSVCSARYFDTSMGYPESADLFSIQEMLDELLSQSATNVLKFGNQNIWGTDGIDFDQQKFAEGGAYFTLKENQEPPKVIQYAQLPEATKYLLEYLPERMNEVIGSNSVMRGDPDSNISSGAYAALMQSIAEKFISATQAAYDFAVNSTGNVILELVRANADNSFAAEVSGEANVPYMKFFTREDLRGIKRVMVNRQSPLMNSIPGRFDVFTATKDLPKDQRWAAVQMLKTGDDSAWTENDFSYLVLLRRENELLSNGQPTPVSSTDDPFLHARSHCASLDRLRTQGEPADPQEKAIWEAAVLAHKDHINEHAIVWSQTNQVYAAMLGLPKPPVFDPASGGFAPQSAAPNPNAAPVNNNGATRPGNGAANMQGGAGLPKQPVPAQSPAA